MIVFMILQVVLGLLLQSANLLLRYIFLTAVITLDSVLQ